MSTQSRSRHIPKEVVEELLQDMRHRCCLCRALIDPRTFDREDLSGYLHKHHIIYFSEGGENTYDNLLLVCPICHAKIHAHPEKYAVDYLQQRKLHWINMKQAVPRDDIIPIVSYIPRHPEPCRALMMPRDNYSGSWAGVVFSVESVNLHYTIWIHRDDTVTISQLAVFIRDSILRPLGKYDNNTNWIQAERVDLALWSIPHEPLDPDAFVLEIKELKSEDRFVAIIHVPVMPIPPQPLEMNEMTLQEKVARTPDVAIFCRNHREYLEEAAKTPEKHITFRAGAVWKSGKTAVDIHGPRKIYFVPIGGKGLVEYEATLEKVMLHPEANTRATRELLENCLDRTRQEGLWEQYGETVRTLYAISGCRKLAVPFPHVALTKISDGLRINANYGYSYSIVYEYCPRCRNSPCKCSD